MRILVIGRALPEEKTGMIGIVEFEHAQTLANQGHKPAYVFCDSRSIKHLRKYGFMNAAKKRVSVYGSYLPIGGLPRSFFKSIKKWHFKKIVDRMLQAEGIPDLVHVHFPLLTLTDDTWDFLKSLDRPIVVTEHWSKVQLKELQLHYFQLLERIVDEADAFIAVGDLLKESVIELTHAEKEIVVIPNMVNPEFYFEKQKPKDERFEFIAIGRLVEGKRFDLVVEAFANSFRGSSNVYMHIVGDGPLFAALKQRIKELALEDRIMLHGFLSREDTGSLLRKSDAFVSASRLETFGVPFIESLACGKPVIGTQGGSIGQYINEANGVLFQQDNLHSLTEALQSVYEKRASYDGRQISEESLNVFSEGAVMERLAGIYAQCLMNRREGMEVDFNGYRKKRHPKKSLESNG